MVYMETIVRGEGGGGGKKGKGAVSGERMWLESMTLALHDSLYVSMYILVFINIFNGF